MLIIQRNIIKHCEHVWPEHVYEVEDDPGDVADEEHDHDADEDRRQVQLAAHIPVGGLLMRVSEIKGSKNCGPDWRGMLRLCLKL